MLKTTAVLFLAMMTALSGCGSYHTDFACNATYPERCAPIHEINDQIDQASLENTTLQGMPKKTVQVGLRQPYPQLPAPKETPNLDNEKVQIWFAGFYDSQGRYHHAHTVDVYTAPHENLEQGNANA